MKLKFFERSEFLCPCCGEEHMDDDFLLLLDRIRSFCWFPFLVSSGWRCEAHNQEIGGADDSAHLRGKAADIRCLDSAQRAKIITTAVTLGVRRIGIARSFVHLDIDGTLPKPRIWIY